MITTYDPKEGLPVAARGSMPAIEVPPLPPAEEEAVLEYLKLAKDVGLLWSLPYLSALIVEPSHIELGRSFAAAEERYAALGYQPISLKSLIHLAGYNRPLPDDEQFCQKLGKAEPVLAAPTVQRVLEELASKRRG